MPCEFINIHIDLVLKYEEIWATVLNKLGIMMILTDQRDEV